MNLKVGDIIYSTHKEWEGLEKEITEVRKTGYTWKYPDIEGQEWFSENSADAYFDHFWKLKQAFDSTEILNEV